MKTKIIAEIGVNHGGDMIIADSLIRVAKNAGADYVKFQLWHKDTFPELEHLRLEPEQLESLIEICDLADIKWFCTPFDEWSVLYLATLGMDIWKIPSNEKMFENERTMRAFLKASRDKQKIISTGKFQNTKLLNKFIFKDLKYQEAPEIIHVIYMKYLQMEPILFHCISNYPLKPKDANLKKIKELKSIWGFSVGYSDHSGLPEIPVAAVVMGAEWIETHITLDKNMEGPDHKASLNPVGFTSMVKMIRNVEKAI